MLKQWPTGQGVDFDDAVKYQKAIADAKRFGNKLEAADKSGETLIQPRAGVALYEEHIKLPHFRK